LKSFKNKINHGHVFFKVFFTINKIFVLSTKNGKKNTEKGNFFMDHMPRPLVWADRHKAYIKL